MDKAKHYSQVDDFTELRDEELDRHGPAKATNVASVACIPFCRDTERKPGA